MRKVLVSNGLLESFQHFLVETSCKSSLLVLYMMSVFKFLILWYLSAWTLSTSLNSPLWLHTYITESPRVLETCDCSSHVYQSPIQALLTGRICFVMNISTPTTKSFISQALRLDGMVLWEFTANTSPSYAIVCWVAERCELLGLGLITEEATPW